MRSFLLVSPAEATAAGHVFGQSVEVLDELPERDGERPWARLRSSTTYILPFSGQDAAIAKLKAMGTDRVAALDLPEEAIWDLTPREAVEKMATAKSEAALRATTADLSICLPPSGAPDRISTTAFWGAEQLLTEAANFAGVTPDYVALPALVSLAGITRGDLVAVAGPGHEEPVILMGALVGGPGAGKTNAFRAIEPGIRAVEKSAFDVYQDKLAFWDATNAEVKRGEREDKPPLEVVRISDCTAESAHRDLAGNPSGMLAVIPELSSLLPQLGLIGADGMYSNAGSLRSAMLSFFDGGVKFISRISWGKDPIRIANYAISILTGAQPDVISLIINSPLRDGLQDRFLLSFPSRPTQDIEKGSEERFNIHREEIGQLFLKIRETVVKMAAKTADGKIRIRFTPAAQETFNTWAKLQRARAYSLDDSVAGPRIKAIGILARICALSAFIRHVIDGTELVMDDAVLDRSIKLLRGFMDHRAVAEAIAYEPIRERKARALARAICERNALSVDPTEVRRSWHILGLRDVGDVREALIELQDLGWFRSGPIGRGPRDPLPGRIDIHPVVLRDARKLIIDEDY
ncbi:MAG: DUF3987 domain-containing protein [Methylococcaceae bacterium]|nr:DUF3987 domain-containing protein [Methylococcaceae bacterium]